MKVLTAEQMRALDQRETLARDGVFVREPVQPAQTRDRLGLGRRCRSLGRMNGDRKKKYDEQNGPQQSLHQNFAPKATLYVRGC